MASTRRSPESGKPHAILLSKRAEVLYLEHARVMQKDGKVVYLTAKGDDLTGIFLNIPFRNTAFVMLGPGTSITDSAARLLAEAGVLVVFTGSGGSPLISAADQVFLSPQSEYRPSEYMQAWARKWFDDGARLDAAKQLLRLRAEYAERGWASNRELGVRKIAIPEQLLVRFERGITEASDTTSLLAAEAEWVRGLYQVLAAGYKVSDFRRVAQVDSIATPADSVNSKLTQGNYIAYGYAAATLYTLGISFAFPALHGKTRRGGLVFDLADLVKDWTVLPMAFHHAHLGSDAQAYRKDLIAFMQRARVLDLLFESMQKVCGVRL